MLLVCVRLQQHLLVEIAEGKDATVRRRALVRRLHDGEGALEPKLWVGIILSVLSPARTSDVRDLADRRKRNVEQARIGTLRVFHFTLMSGVFP